MVKKAKNELDSVFFLKLVIYMLLGAMWIQFNVGDGLVPIPFGLIVGLFLAHHDHFKTDTKIEIAVLLIATVASYVLPVGFVLAI